MSPVERWVAYPASTQVPSPSIHFHLLQCSFIQVLDVVLGAAGSIAMKYTFTLLPRDWQSSRRAGRSQTLKPSRHGTSFPWSSDPRDQGGSCNTFYDQTLEVALCHMLLVKAHTKVRTGLRGRNTPHPLMKMGQCHIVRRTCEMRYRLIWPSYEIQSAILENHWSNVIKDSLPKGTHHGDLGSILFGT